LPKDQDLIILEDLTESLYSPVANQTSTDTHVQSDNCSTLHKKDPTPPISPNKSNNYDNCEKSHNTQSEGSVHSSHSEQIEHSVHSEQSNKTTHSVHSDESSKSDSFEHSERSEYESLHSDRSQDERVPTPPSPLNQIHSDTQYHAPHTTYLRVKIPQNEPPLFHSLIDSEFYKLDLTRSNLQILKLLTF